MDQPHFQGPAARMAGGCCRTQHGPEGQALAAAGRSHGHLEMALRVTPGLTEGIFGSWDVTARTCFPSGGHWAQSWEPSLQLNINFPVHPHPTQHTI